MYNHLLYTKLPAIKFLLLILFCLYGTGYTFLNAQSNYRIANRIVNESLEEKEFIYYSTKEGLTDNSITALTQDRLGYLWIATRQGLNRFDGLNFKPFQSNHSKESLPSDDVLSLKWIDSSRLAIITSSGLNILNIQSMTQENLIIPVGALKYHHKVNFVREFLSDSAGNCYLASKSGFYHFDTDKKLVFRYDDYTPEEAEIGMGFGIFLAWLDHQNIIVAGQKGVYLYNINNRKLSAVKGAHPQFAVFEVINRMGKRNYTPMQPWPGCFLLFINDSDTAIFINEKRKLIKYSQLPIHPLKSEITWQSRVFAQKESSLFLSGKTAGLFKLKLISATGALYLDTAKLLADKKCSSFFIDKQNRSWIGSNNGLLMEKRNPSNLRFANTPEPVIKAGPGAAILQVAVNEKNIFAANLSGSGMYMYNKDDLSFKKSIKFTFPAKGNNNTYAISKRGKDTILCGANMELFWYNAATDKRGVINMPGWDNRHNWVADMFTDSRGDTWITSNMPNGVYLYQKNAALPLWIQFDHPLIKKMSEIFHIAEDKDGNIWMAGDGVARFNISKQQFDLYIDSFPAIRWPKKNIESIVCDKESGVWMGNSTNGLFVYEPATNKFTSFTRAEGLPDNHVLALKIVNNDLWIACLNGIAKMDLKTRQIFQVANRKEIFNMTISSNNLSLDESRQMLYAGLGTTLMQFNVAGSGYKTEPPRLLIETILLGNDSILRNPSGKISTNWNHNDITVSFNTINYHDAQDQRYAYRIANDNDTSWKMLEDQRRIVFNNLAAGKHLMEAKVFSLNNRWPPQFIQLTIFISPPFWKTWWFYVLAVVLISGIIYSVFHDRINQLKKIIALRTNISRDLHDEVGATLSGISMYSHLTKEQVKNNQFTEIERSLNIIQQSAGDMVEKLSDIVWAINPAHDSLKNLIQKIEEYATDMAVVKKIKVNSVMPAHISEIKIPVHIRQNIYLLFKEALNNAVKYSNASLIEFGVISADHYIKFWVVDNGKGFDPAAIRKGNGLVNMQKRAEEIGAILLVSPAEGGGTVISLRHKIT